LGVAAGKTEIETASALNSAAIHLLRRMRPIDRLSGLTDARLSALSVLVFGGPQTMGGLARAEGVASPTMSRIVDGLEELLLAERHAHPDNARMTSIHATELGTLTMRAAATRRIDAIAAALDKLPPDDRSLVVAAADIMRALPDLVERPA
jgi:DNA-binding MarR family transcriptional regulator